MRLSIPSGTKDLDHETPRALVFLRQTSLAQKNLSLTLRFLMMLRCSSPGPHFFSLTCLTLKRKCGVSDISRDQVSAKESPALVAIDEDSEGSGEEEELEEELKPGTSMHCNFSLTTSNAQQFRH